MDDKIDRKELEQFRRNIHMLLVTDGKAKIANWLESEFSNKFDNGGTNHVLRDSKID
jgi:hypothetical protein